MADDGRLRVWTLCEHGSRVRHWWFESEDEDDERYFECPGGKEMVLRKLYSPPDSWQEVDDDSV